MRSYDLGKLSILVLEKHLLVRKLLTDVFMELGVPTVQSTPEPDVAWTMFTQFDTDLIMSDWTHDLDGMGFLRRVRQDPDSANPFVPVIVCTANTEYQHVCHARDMGTTEYLAKPVSAKTIYSRICAVIEHNRPFVRAQNFFGPDRRRHDADDFAGVNRRRQRMA